jgi:ABC-2 type transport system permease protein
VSIDSPPAGLGRPIAGPSALAGDFRRFLTLTWTLAVNEFKLRFFGSIFGYLWQLMRPLMLFGVLYVVFALFIEVSDRPLFPVSLLLGVVLFTFFAEATGGAVACVIERENLVRRINFPRLAIPMSVVLTATFNLGLNLVVVLIFGVALGIDPRWTWLELPILLLGLFLFSVGLAMLLSALFVRFRDIRPIWEVMLQMLFYASMILVPYEIVEAKFETTAKILLLNPLAAIIQQARYAFVDPTEPATATAMGSLLTLAGPVAITLVVFVLGLWVFNREAPRVAEDL